MKAFSAVEFNFLKLNLIIKKKTRSMSIVTIDSSDEFISMKNQSNIYVFKQYMVSVAIQKQMGWLLVRQNSLRTYY